MKSSFLGNLGLFIMSYYLIFVYFIFKSEYLTNLIAFKEISWTWIIFIGLTIIVLGLSLYLFKFKKLQKKVFRIACKNNLSSETLNYLLTIFLAFLAINELSWELIIFVGIIYLIYVMGEIYYLQPLLIPFGYKTYKCKIEGDNEIMVISKFPFSKNKNYNFEELFGNIYLLRSLKENGD